MTTTSSRRARPSTLTIAGIVAGAALVLAAPLAASAHIHVSPEDSDAGATTRLSFSFSHGCDDSPTTALVFTIPEGVDGVTPVLDGAWTITRELGSDGVPTQVTYTAVSPVESGTAATVSLDVIFASSAAETSVAFPVLQKCATGETDWSELIADGQTEDDLEAPVPVVAVGAVVADSGHDHGDDDGDAHADGHTDAATDAGTSADTSSADPVARWLSGGALVAALAALGLVIAGRRRKV